MKVFATSLLHLALFAAFSLFAFSLNPGRLFIGNDGPMAIALVREQMMFFGPSLNLHSNMLQGLGNFSFPLNLSIMPGYWLPCMRADGQFVPAYIYTWFALLMFVTVLLTGWNYRFPRKLTFAAAWLLSILIFPYFDSYFRIYPVTSSSPHFIWYPFAVAVADIGVQRMGGSWRSTAGYALVLLSGIFLVVAASPAAVILMVPFLATSFAVSFLRAGRQSRMRKLAGAGAVLAACAALGWVEYVLGLLLYSNSSFYLNELDYSYAPAREFASILFHGLIKDRAFGTVLFLLAFAGAFFSRRTALRTPAIICMAGQALHAIVAGQLFVMTDGWTGPPPIYSEMTFFSLYALFAVWMLATLGRQYIPAKACYALPVLALLILLALPAASHRMLLDSFAIPPGPSVITSELRNIKAVPGNNFSGRVATVLPGSVAAQLTSAYFLNAEVLNDHQSSGLWLFDIPTLHEYSQLITPAFYRILRDRLTLARDIQNRSVTNFSYADRRILRMLGVRYVLTDSYTMDEATLRAALPSSRRKLYLQELKGANTSGIGVRDLHVAGSVKEAGEFMSQPSFGPQSAVWVGKTPPVQGVSPVDESSITFEKGGWRIRAKSTGTGMLLVPIEYSRCLDITPQSGAAPAAYRLNIALTGLVFEHEMDILMASHIGAFHHPRCRLQDYRDYKEMTKGEQ